MNILLYCSFPLFSERFPLARILFCSFLSISFTWPLFECHLCLFYFVRVFPLGFRADISFLCSTFECFVILLISFGSARFPDGFRSRFTSTFVTHFVLTPFRSRFPLAFRALVFTLSFSGCCCFRTFRALARPLAHLFPPLLCCVRLVSTQFPSTSGRLPLHPLTPRFRPDSGILQDSSHDPTSITTSFPVTRSSSPLIPILVVWT